MEQEQLKSLSPKSVFSVFQDLCAIPHGSGNMAAVSDYCLRFAEQLGLYAKRDAANNVVIKAPATKGYEKHPTVILQAHMDMVAVKTADCGKDLAKDGLTLKTDGEWLFADGTTLGADDGIGVALALSVLRDEDTAHPPLEILLTTDEEIGMLGAAAFDASILEGRRLISLDEEEEGVLTAGCAGGARADCRIPIQWENAPSDTLLLSLDGLAGGHSGVLIHTGRANACILMGRILRELLRETDLRLAGISCNGKDNAIADSCAARITVKDRERAAKCAEKLERQLRSQYTNDPNLRLTLCDGGRTDRVMTGQATERCVDFLVLAPNGVVEMSRSMPGQVQTSLNLGVMKTEDETLLAEFSVRSSIEAQKEALSEKLRTLCRRLEGTVAFRGVYPAWEYRKESALRETVTEVYRELTGNEPRICVTHGGLECGVFSEKLPGADIVTLGPTMEEIHTPRERLNIASVGRVRELLKEILRRC